MKKVVMLLTALVAAVLVLTACGGGSGGGNVVEVTIKAGDDMSFNPKEITAKKGDTLKITLDNSGGTLVHDLVIPALNFTLTTNPGEVKTGEVKVTQSGDLEFYCGQAGHKEGGMHGVLKVSG